MLVGISNLTCMPSFRPIVARGSWLLRIMLGSVVLLFCGFGFDLSVEASEEQPAAGLEIVACKLGFSGAWKVGFWTPLRIDLRGGAEPFQGEVELLAPDRDGVLTAVRQEVQLQPGTVATIVLATKIGIRDSDLTVNLREGDQVVVSRVFSAVTNSSRADIPGGLPAECGLLVEISAEDIGLAETFPSQKSERGLPSRKVVAVRTPDALPTDWYGYDGVDNLVIAAGGLEWLAHLSAEDPRLEAIRRWVQLGGRLTLLAGATAADVLAPGGPLSGLLPGEFQEMVALDRGMAFELFSDSDVAIATPRQRFELPVPRFENVSGQIELFEGRQPADLPLVIRTAVGFGEVIFAAVDLHVSPLAGWSGRPAFLRNLLQLDEGVYKAKAQNMTPLMTRGYQDLAGALNHHLGTTFLGVGTISFSWVTIVVLAYLALIGPIDYLLVKKVFRRMEMSWVTFPLIILLVTGGACWYATATKGSTLRINQAELFDFDLSSRVARGTLWTSIYSPQAETFDLSLQARWPDQQLDNDPAALVSWLGLPGVGIGAAQSAGTELEFNRLMYQYGPALSALVGIPIKKWSTRTILARWHSEFPPALPVVADLVSTNDGLLTGTVTNNSSTKLTDARLLFDTWAWQLGDLTEGAQVTIDDRHDPLKVKTLLTREVRSAAFANDTGGQEVFVVGQASIDQLIDLMMFYDAVGGKRFVRLSNQLQPFLDLSHLLKQGRAILIARSSQPGSELLRDGRPMHQDGNQYWTIYRFVLPVASGEN
jgi:hypothetical protein